MVGAFWQPELVLCDYRTLATLPQEYVIDGMAEVIKYGFISDNELLETLRVDTNTKIEEIIARAIYDKKVLVEADERDRGSRQLLNLGHTLGHAIEKCSQFSLSHRAGSSDRYDFGDESGGETMSLPKRCADGAVIFADKVWITDRDGIYSR